MKNIFKSKKILKPFSKIKILTFILLIVFVFNSLLFIPQPAHAQFVTNDLGQTIANAFHIPNDIYKKISTFLSKAKDHIAKVAFKTALRKLVHNIAYDSATYIASGGKGQSPMFQTNFTDYIQKEGDAFLGDALNNQLKQMWGINLCEPINPFFKVKFQISAKQMLREKRPSCTFTKMMKNIRDIRKVKLVDLPKVADMFNPNSNEIGMLFNFTAQVQEGQKKKQELAKLDLTTNGGWKAVRSVVTGEIKTPAIFTKIMSTKPFEWAFGEKKTFTGDLAADFVETFSNTLLSQLMMNYKKGLFKTKNNLNENFYESGVNSSAAPSAIQSAKERFASLAKFNYNFGGPFDLVNKISCSKETQTEEQQYNCVIDDDFKSILLDSTHLTVREALEKGLLHADWPFGYRADKSGAIDPASRNIYSYRNLLILRKYRVIPVGWELAAQYYALYDKSGQALTLQRLINDYDKPSSPYYRLVDPNWVLKAPETICEREGPGELASKETLKIPADKNNDGKITADEYTELPIRLPYCADERSCIKENPTGTGCEYYGYCTEEKPIWRISNNDGACQPLYNSCRAYKTRQGKEIAYLNNTLWGKDVCDSANAGCREYANVWDSANRTWSSDSADRIYLNYQAADKECQPSEAGCNRFIRLKEDAKFYADSDGNPVDYSQAIVELQNITDSNGNGKVDGDDVGADGESFASIINYQASTETNLRKAPDYLGCAGYTTELADFNNQDDCLNNGHWWRTDIDKCVESGSQSCQDYALYCDETDMGCQFYTPQSYSGPQVPGVANENDYCPAECVGYKNYLEQPSFLDRQSRAVSLIPGTAKSCSAADNGCEEFTNLSEGTEGEKVEYFSAIRSCILPNNPNVATYYSWASTDESGNQLKSWQLLKSNQGEYPCTNTETAADGTVSCTDGQNGNQSYSCHFGDSNPEFNPVYNPDCVEFVAESGSSYWMLYSRVVFTSEDCMPMRRTKTGEVFSINKADSQSCNSQAVGCREYKGSAANNVKTILNDDFEDGTTQGWEEGVPSTESLTAGGHSLLFEEGDTEKLVTDLIHQGKSYKLSFWAKCENSNTLERVSFEGTGGVRSDFVLPAGGITVNNDWKRYEVDLNNLDRKITDKEHLVFWFSLSDNSDLYFDNIVLTETQDDLYLIQDSWQTPESCTQIVDGRDMLGCEAYKDETGQNSYLRSFDHLCRDELVGCEAMIDTYNNSTTTQLTFNDTENSNPDDDVTVPADDLKYLVYDKTKLCNQPGCMALGRVEQTMDGSLKFTNKYLVADAQSFGRTTGINGSQTNPLCLVEENWCDEFVHTGKDGGKEYFKNPGIFTCEYKEVNNNYGWYETGTKFLCPLINSADGSSQGHCLGGRAKNGDLNNVCSQADDCADYARATDKGSCSQWVALCPNEQNNCTEYQDPSNPEGCDKQAVYGINNSCDYYYYLSDKVNPCASKDELGKTCQAFHQTGGGDNIYYSTPRCTGDVQHKCETDSDCVDSTGNSLGTCSYTPPQTTPPAQPPSSSTTQQVPIDQGGQVE